MKSDAPEEEDFVWLGSYAPRQASKLLERFEQAGIAFRAQPLSADGGDYGPTATIHISVDSPRCTEAAQFHRELLATSCQTMIHPSSATGATSNQAMQLTAVSFAINV
jgi:hypothetical protein